VRKSKSLVVVLSLLLTAAAASAAVAADWPCWRGPYRDGICRETGLLEEWPAEGPTLLWKTKELGEGYSGPAIVGSMLYTMGQRNGREWVIALDCASEGRVVWATPISPIRHNGGGYPGPRSTPSVHRGKVYSLGINGDLVCIDATNGRGIWHHNLAVEFGGSIPQWGYSESVLVDGRWVVCTPGGSQATMLALWRLNGEKVWGSPIGDAAAYSSIIKVSIGKTHQYVQFTAKGVVGVKVRGGKLLWRYDKPANDKGINVTTPVWFGQTIFASSDYDAGGGVVWPKKTELGEFTPEEIYFTDKMQNHHGGLIFWDGCLYGCSNPGELKCMNYKTGEVLWTDDSCGKCSLLFADGMLYARSEKGQVSLVRATPEGFHLKGRFNQPNRTRRPSWPHPVISGGRLFLRDQNMLLCYDVKTPPTDQPKKTGKRRDKAREH